MKRLFIIIIGFIWSCQTAEEFNHPATIDRFDQRLMACESEEQLKTLLDAEPLITRAFYRSSPSDTSFVSDLFYMIQHPDARKFYEESLGAFGNLSMLSNEFGKAFEEIRKTYPDFKEPRVVTAFSGLSNDMVISDTLVVISLEAFIGPNASFRPDQPDYVLKRYTPRHIVPNVVRVLSNQFNKVDFSKDNFVADMVFYGKSLEFCRQVLPDTPDSLIIGYTNREMQNAYEHQDYIWGHILDRELLNNTHPAVLAKYFGERPYIAEIGPDCPGRIGQWLGLRVVELYRINNPDISLAELMKTDDPEVILRGSKYRGQKDGRK